MSMTLLQPDAATYSSNLSVGPVKLICIVPHGSYVVTCIVHVVSSLPVVLNSESVLLAHEVSLMTTPIAVTQTSTAKLAPPRKRSWCHTPSFSCHSGCLECDDRSEMT